MTEGGKGGGGVDYDVSFLKARGREGGREGGNGLALLLLLRVGAKVRRK